MEKVGTLLLLHAKAGKEKEAEEFLRSTQRMAEKEPETMAYYVFRIGPTQFGIFDTFTDAKGRDAQVCGKILDDFFAKSGELFESLPMEQYVEIVTKKQQVRSEFCPFIAGNCPLLIH